MGFLRLLYLLIAGAAAVAPDGHFNPALCRYALGMEDGTIRDEDIVATSSWSDSTAAKHGRLSLGNGDGAWCPAGPVYPNNAEFLQVDLKRLHFVTLVATQGRHADGHGNEFARAYRLVYSRNGRTWITWRDRWNNYVVSGNVNTYDIVLKDLGPPIIARYVRFYPMADRVMSVCLRVELYGCEWTDGLKAYTSPISHVMNLPAGPVYLNDSTYDGNIDAGLQYGGLGQLSDGVLGLDDFTEARELRVWPGYDYVGWNREAAGVGFVEMEFEFQERRTFQSMQVHCNNRYQQAVKIFRSVSCLFKPDLLRQWEPEPVSVEVEADVRDPGARTVPVPLEGRSGQMMRCKFYFSDSWLLISEISFITDIGGETPPVKEPPNPALPAPSVMPGTSPKVETPISSPRPSPATNTTTNRTTLGGQGRLSGMGDMTLNSTVEEEDWAMLTPKAGLPVAKDDNSHTSILVGCLVAIILLLLIVIVIILWRQYWKKILGKTQRRISDDDLRVHLSVPNETVVINNTQNPLSAARYANRYERIQPCEGEQGPSYEAEYQEPSALVRKRPESVLTTDSSALLLNSPAYHLLLSANSPQPPAGKPGGQAKPINTDVGYMEPELLKAPPPYGFPSGAPPPCMSPCSSNSVPHYAEADIINLQGVTGNNTYAVPAVTVDALAGKDIGVGEFPREHLAFKEKLGEGQFGEVHLCEIDSPQDLVSLEFPFNIRKGRPLLVAVKILRSDATKNARNDFLKEVKILSRLKDPNIIRLLGVCVRDDPLCMITEYMESGDLNQFLSQRQLQDKASSASSMPTISYTTLISMTSQIASGMKYLASLNFVHRDLATRNCLVGEGDTIKIADFGMSRNLYTSDYYRIQGRAVLPIRWMAWECILMGKFTTASDVWAFGVTLWEMLLLCKEQPYNWLTDEQVIENAGEFFRDQGKQIYLPRPEICPQGLFDLMLRCWCRDSKDRPSFVQIQRFLLEEAMNMV
ncbi:discoidin domain-containing receptor 2-like isoform X1 [Acipenser ruthenus]|uniref:discoidin domain-containing receptor 2-like isoform X1 n=1 Tax=Acipenser ruthenus TaxID=7906 RepID=UPI0027427D7D|nr:discoidin domain-containing receptor 2-like isoform X1 [Acipenser ruthenus]XP_058866797.1 discoidin domain-containing receptor 2-like isoform X1 [Acipenser ruthenus]XP_058866798.1 discoidin domain-containing receptor 2-like isoform X1 [Acipenser ruthenus]XP_058866799.1 discoidin domain-containing receptor 2-like isoform X1 [Acipenser ruthenus]